jgi:hypothetical protein
MMPRVHIIIKKAFFLPTNKTEEVFHPSLMFEMKVTLFTSEAGSPVLPTKIRPGG